LLPELSSLIERTRTCEAPSLQSILQRSENFTSGAVISFTLSGPIVDDRYRPHRARGEAGHASRKQTQRRPSKQPQGTTARRLGPCAVVGSLAVPGSTADPHQGTGRDHAPPCPDRAPRPAQLSSHNALHIDSRLVDAVTCHGRNIQPSGGCLEHTELSTVSTRWAPEAGLGDAGHRGPTPVWIPTPALEALGHLGPQ